MPRRMKISERNEDDDPASLEDLANEATTPPTRPAGARLPAPRPPMPPWRQRAYLRAWEADSERERNEKIQRKKDAARNGSSSLAFWQSREAAEGSRALTSRNIRKHPKTSETSQNVVKHPKTS